MLRTLRRSFGAIIALSTLVAFGALSPVPAGAAASPKPTPPGPVHVAPTSDLSPFSVSLEVGNPASASGDTIWLTAWANQDVKQTPYYIEIFDHTTHTFLKSCGTGNNCTAFVTQFGCVVHQYIAYISALDTNEVPSGLQATSNVGWAVWGASVSLTATPSQPGVNQTVTVTATSCFDVGPTPYYIRLYDVVDGQLLKLSSSGSGFTVTDGIGPGLPDRINTYVAMIDIPAIAVSNPVFLTWH